MVGLAASGSVVGVCASGECRVATRVVTVMVEAAAGEGGVVTAVRTYTHYIRIRILKKDCLFSRVCVCCCWWVGWYGESIKSPEIDQH